MKIIDKKITNSLYTISSILFIPECQVLHFGRARDKGHTSRYSARDKATQFLISDLDEGETIPSVISLFKEDFRNKLVPGSS